MTKSSEETFAGQPMGPQPTNPGYEMLSELAQNNPEGLRRLRAAVRRVHFAEVPDGVEIDDYQVDQLIASLLPETQESFIKKMVDAKVE